MIDHTQREPVRDVAKKRREYLRTAAVKIALALALGFVAIFPMSWAKPILISAYHNRSMINGHCSDWVMVFEVGIYLVVASVGCIIASGNLVRTTVKMPYVPPVAEQLAAVHAEEILVRGSEQPAATSEELLRAAMAGANVPEELLRPETRE